MLRFNRPVTLRLFAGETTALQSDTPVRLRVACGLVWLTRSGDADDHFLGAGQTMALQPGIAVTVGAEQTASLRLEPVDAPALGRAWSTVLAGVCGVVGMRRPAL